MVVFGHDAEKPLRLQFPHEQLGVVSPERLAWSYSEATVGLCLSLTNYSLMPQEMMACGLPCVDLAGGSTEAELGRDAGVEYADADPVALADAMEALLTDESRWRRRSEAGLAMADTASWDVAARQVEHGLREALREREGAAALGATGDLGTGDHQRGAARESARQRATGTGGKPRPGRGPRADRRCSLPSVPPEPPCCSCSSSRSSEGCCSA